MSEDKRKKYVLKLASNFFKREASDFLESSSCDRELSKFLDDLNTPLLVVNVSSNGGIKLVTDVKTVSSLRGKSLAFYKPRAEAIKPDNMENSILITSLADSPVDTLFHLVHNLYSPVIANSTRSGSAGPDLYDEKLSNNLADLETNLKVAIRKLDAGIKIYLKKF